MKASDITVTITRLRELLDARIADLTHCQEHVRAGACPLLAAMTGEVTAAPAPKKPARACTAKTRQALRATTATGGGKTVLRQKPEPTVVDVPIRPAAAKTAPGLSVTLDQVRAFVASSDGGRTPMDVAEKFGLSYQTAWSRLRGLVEGGKAIQGDDKRYHATN